MPNGEDITAGTEPKRNTLAAIAAGVLVVVAGFLVYNYFSRVGRGTKPEVSQEAAVSEEGEIKIPEPESPVTSEQPTPAPEEGTTGQPETTTGSIAGIWTARDLVPNTISGDSYTVQSGDTLWEIAEARYGSGFDWGKILEANKDKVGFLPNGSQALIVPGQVLNLP